MTDVNAEQAEYWANSPGGAKWITLEDRLDAALGPVLELVLERAALQPGERVLDIGCGTGASLIRAAEAVGETGHVLGADISTPFVDRARTRTAGLPQVEAIVADAQTHDFEPGRIDAIISRFGVMFFEDTRAAFANMARALRPGGRMVFAAWGRLANNPWFMVPHQAAVARLGRPPSTDRNAPGPLAFHDIDRISGFFAEAGLEVQAEAVSIGLTPMGLASGAAAMCMKVGPAVRVIAHFGGSDEDEAAIEAEVLRVFQTYPSQDPFVMPAEINLFHATLPEG